MDRNDFRDVIGASNEYTWNKRSDGDKKNKQKQTFSAYRIFFWMPNILAKSPQDFHTLRHRTENKFEWERANGNAKLGIRKQLLGPLILIWFIATCERPRSLFSLIYLSQHPKMQILCNNFERLIRIDGEIEFSHLTNGNNFEYVSVS